MVRKVIICDRCGEESEFEIERVYTLRVSCSEYCQSEHVANLCKSCAKEVKGEIERILNIDFSDYQD